MVLLEKGEARKKWKSSEKLRSNLFS